MVLSPEFLNFGVASAQEIMEESIKTLDAKYGEGYTKSHPELLSAFMQVAATTMHSRLVGQIEGKKPRR